jgi:hypothetical protein
MDVVACRVDQVSVAQSPETDVLVPEGRGGMAFFKGARWDRNNRAAAPGISGTARMMGDSVRREQDRGKASDDSTLGEHKEISLFEA